MAGVPASSRGGALQATAPKTLTVLQQLALNTAPQILAAGVTNTILVPVVVMANTHGGAAGYTLASAVVVSSGDPDGAGTTWWALPQLTNAIQQGPGFFSADQVGGNVGASVAPTTAPGGALYLYADTGNPTLGDSLLTVQVFYVAYAL